MKKVRVEKIPVAPLASKAYKTEKVFVDAEGEQVSVDEIEALELADMEDSQKLDEFKNLFGERNYFLRIERLNDATNEWELCEKVSLNVFDPLIVGNRYGGGKFTGTLFSDAGKYVKGGRMRFNVARRAPDVEKPAAVDPMQNPMIQMLIENMKAEKVMLASLLEKMLTAEKPQPQPINDLLAGLKQLQDLSPKEKTEPNAMKQMMELLTFQEQMKKAMGVGDKEEGGPGLLAEITEALKLLPTLRGMKPAPRPGQIARTTVGGLPVVTAPPAQPKEEIPMTTLDRKLNFYLPALAEAAANQGDVDKWAAWLISVLDNEIVPALVEKYHGLTDADGVWERLIEAANDPAKTEKIFTYAPILEPHRTWVMNVLAAAVRDMTDEEAPVPVNGAGTDAA